MTHEEDGDDGATGSFIERMLDAQPDALYAFDPDGTLLEWNRRVPELTGYADEELAAMHPLAFVAEADRDRVAAAFERVLRTGSVETVESTLVTNAGERLPRELVASRIVDDDGEVVALTGAIREASAGRRRGEEAPRQRDELETLHRINTLIQEIIGALVTAGNREDIEETICEQLAASDLYRFAWIGEPEVGEGDGVRYRVGAGIDEGAVEELSEGDTATDRPTVRAIETGELQVIEDVREEPSLTATSRKKARERGIASGVAVPLRYGRMIYGVLVVGSDRPKAFSEHERTGFDVLGDVVSFAIHATKQRHLLLSDTVIELEFRITDRNSFFTALSSRLDCVITLDGTVPIDNGVLLYYVSVTGADPDEVGELITDAEYVEDARLVTHLGTECQYELVVTGSSATLSLSELGATIRSAVADHGESMIVAEVAPTEDIRGIVERFQSLYPDSELVAKREVERSGHTAQEFRQILDTRLTDRQRTVLQVAYFAGYYEWPRESTAEELAASMGISSPTFHQHLRAAQQKLLTTFFDDAPDDGDD